VCIQVLQGRATNPSGIRRELSRWQRQFATDADGWLGAMAGVTEDGWSVVVMHFASEAQACRSSDRPEHRAWWWEASRHLGEVAFHDAPQVRLFGDGRSDLAGYVQVIQGHIDDRERMASLGGDQEEVLAREAPHILGVTVAEHADRPGDFTQILYFTSEQDARRFEQEPWSYVPLIRYGWGYQAAGPLRQCSLLTEGSLAHDDQVRERQGARDHASLDPSFHRRRGRIDRHLDVRLGCSGGTSRPRELPRPDAPRRLL
jgi:hypothetical protein